MIRMPHLNWRQRAAFTAAAAVVGLVGGWDLATAPIASAHDFGVEVSKPTCLDGATAKQATITVTNQFDMDAKAFTAHLSGGFAAIAPHGTYVFTETAPSTQVGISPAQTVRLIWTDGFTKDHTYQVNWGTAPCPGVPSTTSTTICPPGQHYSNVPPNVGCAGDTPPPPTVDVPATNAPEVTTTTSTVPAVIVSTPPSAAPPAQHVAPPKTPTQLPPTGAGEIVAWCVILGVLACLGGWLAWRVDRERRRSARQ
jgi:hypothetical protein